MRHDIGPHGLDLIKSFEGFRGYVYDDMDPREREWQGGPVRGTLTIGYGHTDAARHPLKITQGLRVTQEEATEILHVDLGECVENVNDLVKVPLTQGQFDALVSFDFNCGCGNLRQLIRPLNASDYDKTRGDFGHYIRSKGVVMAGLERRRHAEQQLWDDNYDAVEHPTEPVTHPADVDTRPEPPKPAAHVTPVAIGTVAAGAGEGLHTINTTLSTLKDTHDGIGDVASSIASDWAVWLAVAVIAGVAVLWWSHHRGGN